MKKELYKEYGELDLQIKKLQDRQKAIKSELEEDMKSQEVDKVQAEFGTFFLVTRKTWKYSDEVKAKETEVKVLKKTEEETGKAESTESTSLSFRAKTLKEDK